jgi:tetratricopeptide (TPR) repeat protein
MASKIPWTKADIDRLLPDEGSGQPAKEEDQTEGMEELRKALITALRSMWPYVRLSDATAKRNLDALIYEVFPDCPQDVAIKPPAARWRWIAIACATAACIAVAIFVFNSRRNRYDHLLASVCNDFDRGDFRVAHERITQSEVDRIPLNTRAKLTAALRVAKRRIVDGHAGTVPADPWQLPPLSPSDLVFKGLEQEQLMADLKVLSQSRWAQFALGVQFLESGRDVEAFQHFDRMVDRYPDEVAMWGGRGVAAARMGRVQDARESFERGLALRPGNLELQRYLDDIRRRAPVKR